MEKMIGIFTSGIQLLNYYSEILYLCITIHNNSLKFHKENHRKTESIMSWKGAIWDFKGIINTGFVFPLRYVFQWGEGGKICFIYIHPQQIFAQQAFLSREVRAEGWVHLLLALSISSSRKHWFLFSFHSCWHLFVFLWDGNRIRDLFPSLDICLPFEWHAGFIKSQGYLTYD